MSLKKISAEELKTKSMLELASLILRDAKKAQDFQKLYDEVSKLKGFTKKEKEERIAQFYTELNVAGHFMTTGENAWGLKEWYPVEQADEEITAPPKKKRKAKKKKDDEEDDELELEEDLDLVELGDEEEDEEDENFKPLEEDLDVEEEDLDEEISHDGDEKEQEENY